MKKFIAIILALVMCLSLCACGAAAEPAIEPTTDAAEATTEAPNEPPLTEEQLMIMDVVKNVMAMEEFEVWEELYTQFTGEKAQNEGAIADVTHYQIPDFEGEKMDCYLINIPTDIGRWVNEEAEQGVLEESIYLFVDAESKTVYDSITTDAMNGASDTSTELGRAAYLMWIYSATQTGGYDGNYLNETETVTHMSGAEVEAMNKILTSKG